MLEELRKITQGYQHRFPEGNHPFQIMTRLLEEAGELAQTVNHFEGTGIKREKYGQPDPAHLAKEIKDVLLCALQTAEVYQVWPELEEHLRASRDRLSAEGHLPQ